MGCFLGCFGDAKDGQNKKQRTRRASPKGQFLQKRDQVENDRQQSTVVDQSILETPPTNLVSELQNKPKEEEKVSPSPSPSPSPKKRVTFNSNITKHDHVSVFESTDSLPECDTSMQREKEKDLKASNQGYEDGNSVTSVGSYPSNHRYHNAVDSDNEAEDYGDSEDLDDLDDFEDEEGFSDCDEDDVDSVMNCQDIWSESIVISAAESRIENHSANSIDEEVESRRMETTWQPREETEAFESKTNARDRRDYVNSVLNPVENITQWKAIKSKGNSSLLKPQKENLTSYSEHTCKHISLGVKTRSDELKKSSQEMAVDASLSNWLVSPEITPSKHNFSSQLESITSGNSISKGSHSVRSFEDRPILGALTVDELKQISLSSSPKKTSPIRNPDEMPIIGSVGTYWNHSGSTKNLGSISSYKGIPNTTSKYGEDKIVHWQSTPFETRLERALNQGSTEA